MNIENYTLYISTTRLERNVNRNQYSIILHIPPTTVVDRLPQPPTTSTTRTMNPIRDGSGGTQKTIVVAEHEIDEENVHNIILGHQVTKKQWL